MRLKMFSFQIAVKFLTAMTTVAVITSSATAASSIRGGGGLPQNQPQEDKITQRLTLSRTGFADNFEYVGKGHCISSSGVDYSETELYESDDMETAYKFFYYECGEYCLNYSNDENLVNHFTGFNTWKASNAKYCECYFDRSKNDEITSSSCEDGDVSDCHMKCYENKKYPGYNGPGRG